jgi:ADP-heptose:LPS heptosyltransferase
MIFKRIIISRTDSIGDVVLTLPMAGIIKNIYPACKILFLGRTYTQPIINTSVYVDEFINWDVLENEDDPVLELKKIAADVIIHVFPNKKVAKIAFKAKIPFRIGTSGRVYHLLNCNKKVNFSRKKSELHESQLNLKLLSPLGITDEFSLEEIINFYGVEKVKSLSPHFEKILSNKRTNIILHPKSKGSAIEWGLERFAKLIDILPEEQYKIFITGTEEEGKLIGETFPFDKPNVISLMGKLTLDELISFIFNADALVAASTGPLHVAAAFNKRAIGLFSPKRPIHPGRWRPLGEKAESVVFDDNCKKCYKGEECSCITKISPDKILNLL